VVIQKAEEVQNSIKVKIESVERFQEDNFFMKTKPEKKLSFKAGQFVMINIDGVHKPFSIASFPGEDTLDFLISVHPDGEITPKLAKLKPGEEFEVEGPYGMFFVKDTPAKEIIFIAAGTGIAPFRSMVTDALFRFPDKKVTLIFGFRYDFYFKDFWKKLQKVHKNLRICACCTRPHRTWKGYTGRVTEHLGGEIKNAKDKEVYICGPPPMVKDTREHLKEIGFADKQIRLERW